MTLTSAIVLICLSYLIWWVGSRFIYGYFMEAKHEVSNDSLALLPLVAEMFFTGRLVIEIIAKIDQGIEKLRDWLIQMEKSPINYGRRFYRYFKVEDSKLGD